jgi:hypothetical protein
MTEFKPFEISDYLDSDEVIAEYLAAAAEDPNPEVLSRAQANANVARARLEKAARDDTERDRAFYQGGSVYGYGIAILVAIIVAGILAQFAFQVSSH